MKVTLVELDGLVHLGPWGGDDHTFCGDGMENADDSRIVRGPITCPRCAAMIAFAKACRYRIAANNSGDAWSGVSYV